MLAQTCRHNLIAIATTYAKATGISLKQVSKNFYGNRDFLDAFKRREKSVSLDKFDEMIATFRAEWPKGTAWPFTRAAMIQGPTKRKTVPT